MSQHSQIVSQQVFGSSKRVQLVNSSPTQTQQSMSIEALLDSNGDSSTTTASNKRTDISISALTNTTAISGSFSSASSSASPNFTTPTMASKRRWIDDKDSNVNINNNSYNDDDLKDNNKDETNIEERVVKQRKHDNNSVMSQSMTTIKCLHAAVAQKSYGSEKRFLCPPPVVTLRSHGFVDRHAHDISMAIVCENGERPLEQRVMLDETLSGSFKFLHVTGTAKAKQFCLRVSLNLAQQEQPYATFLSHPISIISKPSKKTAKARNVSSCILTNAPISLFNRINSQTVRTKYLTSADNRLCAKNALWSPFDIILVRPSMQGTVGGPNHYQQPHHQHLAVGVPATTTAIPGSASTALTTSQAAATAGIPVTYGTELILRDHNTGTTSPLLIIRKVDKGRIAPCAFGPVSQMQKVALQLASTNGRNKPMYLSAAGATMDGICSDGAETGGHTSSSWIDFSESRIVRPNKPSLELAYEEVDDYLCWTIVGIAQFEYSFFEPERSPLQEQQASLPSPPSQQQHEGTSPSSATSPSSFKISQPTRRSITPFPVVSSVLYKPDTHSVDIFGEHLIQAAPDPQMLECYLGPHGSLSARHVSSQPEQPGSARHSTHVSVELPTAMEVLKDDSDNNTTSSIASLIPPSGHVKRLELPLLFVRQDGVVYHSGKAIEFSIWSVIRDENNNNKGLSQRSESTPELAQSIKVVDCRA
ncbi:hypothetical protein BDC45DRAFT_522868 [Circinella umbellata]|nr:hypothetical protein BDC45DRAFT_522868 [Circinella umbellata]